MAAVSVKQCIPCAEKNIAICILKETSRKSDDESGPRSPSDVYSSDDDKVINL